MNKAVKRRIDRPVPAYEVGYRKPPTNTKFQPGPSRNPKGRPKGATGVRTLVNNALDETIRTAENAQSRSIRERQAILMAMIARAIRGDVRAASLAMRLMEAHDPAPRTDENGLTHEDWLQLLSDDQLETAIIQLTRHIDVARSSGRRELDYATSIVRSEGVSS